MKINKQKFNDLGINCDRYYQFLLQFEEGAGEGHHVYPVKVFKDETLIVNLSMKDHTRAHLYLVLDNLDLVYSDSDLTEEQCQILRGILPRYNFYEHSKAFYEEDLVECNRIFMDVYSKIRSYELRRDWNKDNSPYRTEAHLKLKSDNAKKQHQENKYYKELMSNVMKDLNKDPEFRRKSREAHFTSETHPEVGKKISKAMTEVWSSDNHEVQLNKMREGKLRGILNRVVDAGLELTEENFNLISAKMRGHPHWKTIINFPNLINEFNLDHLFIGADNT